MSDPSTLTKAKLKEELKLHNIQLPKSDSLKQVYVDLYRQHILKEEEDSEDEISNEDEIEDQESEEEEESNDDPEIIFQTPSQKLPQKKKSNLTRKKLIQTKISYSGNLITNQKQDMAAISVKDLTDEELAAELKQYGLEPGPIMATTRSVYERKLIKFRQDRGDSIEQLEESQYDEVPDDEENTSFDNPPPKPSPSRKPRLTAEGTALTRRKLASMRSEPPPEEIDRPEVETMQPEQPTEPKQKSGTPVWVKLLILVILAFFVYLVYINMEPSTGNKVPRSID